MFKLKFNQL